MPEIHNLLHNLYLHLKANNFKDLARLVDVLRLHGFLPYFDAQYGQIEGFCAHSSDNRLVSKIAMRSDRVGYAE